MTAVEVDYDPDVWIELPSEPGTDVEAWALETAQRCFQEADLSPDERALTLLSSSLLSLATWSTGNGALSFVQLRHPEAGPGVLAVLGADVAGDGSEWSLRRRLHADDDDLVEPAGVTSLDTPLGPALRVRRYARSRLPDQPPGTLVSSLGYAWCLPQIDSDLWLSCGDLDLGQLAAAEDDLDALARAVRLVD